MIVKHSWKKADGFRKEICRHCNLERSWDRGYGRLVYSRLGMNPTYRPPECKRVYFSDVIPKQLILK
jgi:hypothetical protein